ncbi:MAG: tyrosine-type recombinase/integrase, partial [Oceanicaulis sp.]|nr:tyrosine-type recombinase/integrase [Oceanicaulis sp.]
WLAKTQLSAGTQREYRRFFKTAAEHLPTPHRVTRDDARLFAQLLAEEGGVDGSGFSRKTVSNHLTALSRLWGHLGLDKSIWRDIDFEPTKAAIKRDIWTLEETIRLLDAARALKGEAGVKLPLVIRLALYTGERAKELAGMRYDAENDWIVIHREDTKTDAGERAVPCPDAIRADVKAWVADPWSTQSVSNRFSELKRGLGFTGRNKVLHSFRHTLMSRLHELGVQEATTAKIVGHKHKGMTYGVYGSKTSVESLREFMNALDWDERLEEERALIARRQAHAQEGP